MNEIHFNKEYKKLHGQKTAMLMDFKLVKKKDLSPEFIETDTEGFYELKDGQLYLLLAFLGDKNIKFTTLRKYNEENKKYTAGLFQYFKIVIDNKE